MARGHHVPAGATSLGKLVWPSSCVSPYCRGIMGIKGIIALWGVTPCVSTFLRFIHHDDRSTASDEDDGEDSWLHAGRSHHACQHGACASARILCRV